MSESPSPSPEPAYPFQPHLFRLFSMR